MAYLYDGRFVFSSGGGYGLGELPVDSAGHPTIPFYCAAAPFLSSCRPSAGQITDSLCNLPLSQFLDVCKPETKAQMEAGLLGPGASPATVAAAQAAYAQTDVSQCAADPAGCAAYKTAIAHPTASSIFGTDIASFLPDPNAPPINTLGLSTWALVAIALGAGILVFAMPARRRR